MENNAAAVDRIQENRNLWHSAGGFDPDLLATPSEIQLEEVKRVLATLDSMLEKNGPRGGLDSFVSEIKAAAALLKVVTWEAIRTDTLGGFGLPLPHELCLPHIALLIPWCPEDRFILTPQGMHRA